MIFILYLKAGAFDELVSLVIASPRSVPEAYQYEAFDSAHSLE